MSKGLSSETAQEKLRQYGLNELSPESTKSNRRILRDVLTEPMIFLLICCSALYFVIGERIESIVLFLMIGMIVLISVFQRVRSEKALEKLRELASPRALVLRDGKPTRIPGREVVPHDVCILSAGDRIPADGRLLNATNLLVNEAILTGESQPVVKSTTEENQFLYAGTMVLNGVGMLFVTDTGDATKFGQIGKSLHRVQKTQTPLQKAVKRIVRIMGTVALSVSLGLTLMVFLRQHNLTNALLSGLATSMALIPEEFPVILTVFLALGAWRLSRVNVLTRDPAVIETLGSATVLCADKTGTITQNDMALKYVADFNHCYELNQKPEAHYIEMLHDTFMASDPNSIDPTEKGIRKSLVLMGFKAQNPLETQPFDHAKNYSSFCYTEEGKWVQYIKGAPEKLIRLCQLSTTQQKSLEIQLTHLTSNGFRVLLVMKTFSKEPFSLNSKKPGQFVCLIALEDPIRKEVPEAIRECHSAGINVIMMTGDHSNTAAYIGKQIGLQTEEVLSGKELMELNDQELFYKLKKVQVISRVEPAHKLRIVKLLQRRKHIVAMTGDGVNDAPSLKAAHIGIAMGNKGTDVAREAASLVLLDDNFASIVGGIKMGRRIADNIEKAMSYALAVHIPIIGLALSPMFSAQFPILLLPIHIVFMELVIDPVSSVAFESEQMEDKLMTDPPKRNSKNLFTKKAFSNSILEGTLIFGCVLSSFFFHAKNTDIAEVRAICFFTLITCNVLLALSKLSRNATIFQIIRLHNPIAKMILSVSFILSILCLFVPFLQNLFEFKSPNGWYFLQSLFSSLILLILLEIIKRWKREKHSKVHYPEKSFQMKKK